MTGLTVGSSLSGREADADVVLVAVTTVLVGAGSVPVDPLPDDAGSVVAGLVSLVADSEVESAVASVGVASVPVSLAEGSGDDVPSLPLHATLTTATDTITASLSALIDPVPSSRRTAPNALDVGRVDDVNDVRI